MISFCKRSAWAGEKFYLADLQLQANIVKEGCRCVVQSDEPVITLAKQTRESWCSLLKQRVSRQEPWLVHDRVCSVLPLKVSCSVAQNPNVAFDFDHWEECEEDSHFPSGKRG